MCQLLGMNCNTPTDIQFSFEGFAKRGGLTDEHADGWGIAFFEGSAARCFIDHRPASDSPVAELIRNYPIRSYNVISHIRKATVGQVKLQNCHPFIRELWGQAWVFAHNGDLKDFNPNLQGDFLPIGETDSELAFCLLLQTLKTNLVTVPPATAPAWPKSMRCFARCVRRSLNTAPSTCCCPTGKRCTRIALPNSSTSFAHILSKQRIWLIATFKSTLVP